MTNKFRNNKVSRKLFWLSCLLSCSILVGCGSTNSAKETAKKSENSQQHIETEAWQDQQDYSVSFQKLEVPVDVSVSHAILSDEILYFIGREKSNLENKLFGVSNEKWFDGKQKAESLKGVELPFQVNGNIMDLSFGVNGTLYILCYQDGPKEESLRNVLYQLDSKGIQIKEYDISQLLSSDMATKDISDHLMRTAVVTTQGTIFLVDSEEQSTIIFLNPEEKINKIQKLDSTILDIVTLENGAVYAVSRKNNNYCILQGDSEKGQLQELLSFPENMTFSGFVGASDGKLYINGQDTLYQLDVEKKEFKECFSWKNGGINSDELESSYYLSGKATAGIIKKRTGERTLAIFTQMQSSQSQEREIVILGCSSASDEFKRLVSLFNVSNTSYQVEIREYSFGKSLERMGVELQSGKGPDLISLNGIYVEEYVRKGLLEDLWVYLDNSTTISREDLVENVLELNTVDGVLTCIPPAFLIDTVVGRTSQVGEDMGWTMDEFMDLVKKHPGAEIFGGQLYGQSKDYIVAMGMMAYPEQYIDWDNYTAHFNTPEFIELLRFADEYESAYAKDTASIVKQIRAGNVLLYNWGVWNVDDYLNQKAIFEDEVTFIGYPSKNGEPTYGIRNFDDFGIRSGSKVKEGAWAFLEFMLKNRNGKEVEFGFPTRKETLKVMYDESKNLVPNLKQGLWGTWEDGVVFSGAHAEDLKHIEDLMEHATYVIRINNPIEDIVYEEINSLFTGLKSAEAVAEIIQNRAQLYLEEQK